MCGLGWLVNSLINCNQRQQLAKGADVMMLFSVSLLHDVANLRDSSSMLIQLFSCLHKRRCCLVRNGLFFSRILGNRCPCSRCQPFCWVPSVQVHRAGCNEMEAYSGQFYSGLFDFSLCEYCICFWRRQEILFFFFFLQRIIIWLIVVWVREWSWQTEPPQRGWILDKNYGKGHASWAVFILI